MNTRLLKGLLLASAAVFASAAPSYGAIKLAANQVLKIGNGAEPKELDPAKTTGVPEHHLLQNLFEGLTAQDPLTLDPIPGIAESWTISPDGKTYTFKIRKNAKWSDGKALTAEDFVWSWRRALDPKTAGEYAYQLYYVTNGEEYNTGKVKDAAQVGVVAKDPYTLVVSLKAPTPFFLRLTSFQTLYPTPRHVVEKFPGNEWTREGNMVSSGAFKLAEWKINKHIKMVPNEHYWDVAKVKLKEIYFYPIENIDTEEKTFTQGALHMTNEVPNLKIPKYQAEKAKSKGYHAYRSDPYLGTYFYRFNVTRKPLNDIRVRRALTLAIDRKLLIDKVILGGQRPATSFTPPNTAGYTYGDVLNPTLDPASLKEAKKLLADAGYPDGKGFPKIDILYNTSENHKKIAVAIQQMWKKNLGVDIGLFNQEWKVYLNSQTQLQYDMSRAGWIGDYPDPNTFLDMWLTNGGNNNTGWSNKQYDELIAQAGSTNDQAKRFDSFKKAEKILLDELPVLPIYIYTRNRLISEKVVLSNKDGQLVPWQPNILDSITLKYYALAE